MALLLFSNQTLTDIKPSGDRQVGEDLIICSQEKDIITTARNPATRYIPANIQRNYYDKMMFWRNNYAFITLRVCRDA